MNEIIKKNGDLKINMENFFEECAILNKILRKSYELDENCYFEYQKNGNNQQNNKNEDKNLNIKELEILKKFAFSQNGAIMNLVKFYEDKNFEKMRDELTELEKITRYIFSLDSFKFFKLAI